MERRISLKEDIRLRYLKTYQRLEPIKDQETHQDDIKLIPTKILEQTLIRKILSYSFNSSYQILTAISSVCLPFIFRLTYVSIYIYWQISVSEYFKMPECMIIRYI
jgi:hypothetical protein